MANYIKEPSRNIPLAGTFDICVIGGSCTGLFAAVRAARLGAKVVIIEKQNCFGGVATNGLVNVWHSLHDIQGKNQIIGGMTHEVIQRLETRNGIERMGSKKTDAFILNTEELKIELDEVAKESGIKIYFHAYFSAPFIEDGELKAIFIETKSGRKAIEAKIFIDATGDGDLCSSIGAPYVMLDDKQPPTSCAKIFGLHKVAREEFNRLIAKHRKEFQLEEDWGWGGRIPFSDQITFHAETHVFDVNCADADDLTFSEIEGRRQIRAYMDIIRKYKGEKINPSLVSLCSYIGVRETRRLNCVYQLKENDVLYGTRFDDAIANGTYPVDIHHDDKKGITFKYLDGSQRYSVRGADSVFGRWREDDGYTLFYQIPYRSLLPKVSFKNIIACGRMIDADRGAYGAARVMVNLNQTGEAAGVAAFLALNQKISVQDINIKCLRNTLQEGGSIII